MEGQHPMDGLRTQEEVARDKGYPDNNPKTMFGMLKAGIMGIPARALYGLGRGFADGIEKYGLYNWREKKVSSSVYFEAANRHLWLWWDGEEFSRDTVAKGRPVHHLEHVMACCAIILDGQDVGNLNDDRGPAGKLSDWLEKFTEDRKAASAKTSPPAPPVKHGWHEIMPDALGHRTRPSDSSFYDEICVLCGGTDAAGDSPLKRTCLMGRTI